MLQGLLGDQGDDGVDVRVESFDPLQVGLHHFARAQLPRAHRGGEVLGRLPVNCGHVPSSAAGDARAAVSGLELPGNGPGER